MPSKNQCLRVALIAGLLGLGLSGLSTGETIDLDVSEIDQAQGWVSSYWGSNAPKLVYDGNAYYSVGYWGAAQSTSEIKVYKYEDGTWTGGFNPKDANYQPGMLLLDSQGRLILVYSQMNAAPKIFRSNSPGDINNFSELSVTGSIAKAGYIGACIYNDVLTLGFVGDPGTYSFQMASLNLDTGIWTGPLMLAPAQRTVEPWTTWVYPILIPDATGIHVAISNNPNGNNLYNDVRYMYVPHDLSSVPPNDLVSSVPSPWNATNYVFADSMWRGNEGSIYISVREVENSVHSNHLYRRDPVSGLWNDQPGFFGIEAVFQTPYDVNELWRSGTYGDRIRLSRSLDRGMNWTEVDVPSFPPGFSAGFLYGINPGSGSIMPNGPSVVFSNNLDNGIWMTAFSLPDTWTVPDSLDFGTVDASIGPYLAEVVITAVTATVIENVSANISSPFALESTSQPLPAALADGATMTVTYSYDPLGNTGATDSVTVTITPAWGGPMSNELVLTGATVTEVPDLATARSAAPGAFKIGSTLVCTAADFDLDSATRNAYFADPSSVGVRFGNNTSSQDYAPGDTLTGVVADFRVDVSEGGSLLVADFPTPPSEGTPGPTPSPVVIYGAGIASTFDGTFVRVNGVKIISQDIEDEFFNVGAPGSDGNEENLVCTSPDGVDFVIRIEDNSPIRGRTGATSSLYTFDVIGIKGFFAPDHGIFGTDVQNFDLAISGWQLY